MEKKLYIKPLADDFKLVTEQLMITASPGVDDNYDPGKPIDSKGSNFFDEEDDEDFEKEKNNTIWGY